LANLKTGARGAFTPAGFLLVVFAAIWFSCGATWLCVRLSQAYRERRWIKTYARFAAWQFQGIRMISGCCCYWSSARHQRIRIIQHVRSGGRMGVTAKLGFLSTYVVLIAGFRGQLLLPSSLIARHKNASNPAGRV
jgi:hypothetical protein